MRRKQKDNTPSSIFTSKRKKSRRTCRRLLLLFLLIFRLAEDLGNNAGSDGSAAFADSETETFFDSDRGDEFNFHRNVVARHNHFNVSRQFDGTGNVGRSEVELRTISVEERGVTSAFLFLQDVNLSAELGVRIDGAGFSKNLTSLNTLTIDTTEKCADVIASVSLVEELSEHFKTGDGGFNGVVDTNDLNLILNFYATSLNSTGCNGTAAGDGEDVFNRHKERLVGVALGSGDVCVDSVEELLDALASGIVNVTFGCSFESLERTTLDDRGVVAGELVLAEQVSDFHFNELEKFGVVNLVGLVKENDNIRNAYLTSEQDVLSGLGHRAVGSSNDEDSAVHLCRAGALVWGIGPSVAATTRIAPSICAAPVIMFLT